MLAVKVDFVITILIRQVKDRLSLELELLLSATRSSACVCVCVYRCELSAQYSSWCFSSGVQSRMSGSADEKSILILKEKR